MRNTLKIYQEERGFSLQQLADHLDMPGRTVSRYIAGESMSWKRAHEISLKTGLPVAEILNPFAPGNGKGKKETGTIVDSDIEALRSELTKYKRAYKNAAGREKRLKEELERLKEENARLKGENARLKEGLAKLKREKASLVKPELANPKPIKPGKKNSQPLNTEHDIKWYRNMDGSSSAHFYVNGRPVCASRISPGELIEINDKFPAHKKCGLCKAILHGGIG